MKLPSTLDVSFGTRRHVFFTSRLYGENGFGISLEKVVFGDDVLSRSPVERAAIVALLQGLDGGTTGLGRMANDADYPLTVINSWHTSDSDDNEHLTIRRENGKICHVYIDGEYTCW